MPQLSSLWTAVFPPSPQLTAAGWNKAASTPPWLGCAGPAHHLFPHCHCQTDLNPVAAAAAAAVTDIDHPREMEGYCLTEGSQQRPQQRYHIQLRAAGTPRKACVASTFAGSTVCTVDHLCQGAVGPQHHHNHLLS